jgi:hypothetical protein
VVHSVELTFDMDADAAIRGVWDELTRAGVKSQASNTSPSNRPHVTLTVAEHMDDSVNVALRPLLAELPLSCTIGAPMLFGRKDFTLVRLVVPSAELLALHAEVHRVCAPHIPDGVLPHADPGQWTPHVTLARRVAADQLRTALSLRPVTRTLTASAAGLRHWDGNRKIEYPIAR